VRAHQRRGVLIAVAALVAVCLPTFAVPALADHDRPVPSQQQVDRARHRADQARLSVRQIEQRLAAASRRLSQLQVAALQAVQRYDGAVSEYRRDLQLARLAQLRATRLTRQTEHARRQVAQVAIDQSMIGGSSTMLGTAMKAHGQRQLIDSASTYQSTEQYLQALHENLSAKSHLAKVYRQQADTALAKAAVAKKQAADAKRQAEQAVAAEQSAVQQMAVMRRHLIYRLARMQHISVTLATQRQLGIEQQRQLRLERERRAQLIAAEHSASASGATDPATPTPKPTPSPKPAPTPSPSPVPPPPNPQPSPNPPPSGDRARVAIRFAMAQLGEPYVWGGAGPNVWDCSGLTMMAWRAAGVYLDHYAPTQYLETTPVSYSQLRPGDLVYWASNRRNPATIFHAAMYIGGGQIIEAPHTGDVVKIIGMLDWQMPAFFGRP
jgi:cell wall-associated NlpC family hydrolase